MNERPTKTIELPESKNKVDLKLWINGKEAEYIEAPIFKAASLTGKASGGDMSIGFNAETVIHEQNHRQIEMRVGKIVAGERILTEKNQILEYVLEELPNSDYEFILSEIQKIETEAKKKLEA